MSTSLYTHAMMNCPTGMDDIFFSRPPIKYISMLVICILSYSNSSSDRIFLRRKDYETSVIWTPTGPPFPLSTTAP